LEGSRGTAGGEPASVSPTMGCQRIWRPLCSNRYSVPQPSATHVCSQYCTGTLGSRSARKAWFRGWQGNGSHSVRVPGRMLPLMRRSPASPRARPAEMVATSRARQGTGTGSIVHRFLYCCSMLRATRSETRGRAVPPRRRPSPRRVSSASVRAAGLGVITVRNPAHCRLTASVDWRMLSSTEID
jgi:hypothetical protein